MEQVYERCRRCKRPLRNPEARKIGLGSVCRKKVEFELVAKEDGSIVSFTFSPEEKKK